MNSVANKADDKRTIRRLRNRLLRLDADIDAAQKWLEWAIPERDSTQRALATHIREHDQYLGFDLDARERAIFSADDDETIARMNAIAGGPSRYADLIEVLNACRDPKLPKFMREQFENRRKQLLAEQVFAEGITPCLVVRDDA